MNFTALLKGEMFQVKKLGGITIEPWKVLEAAQAKKLKLGCVLEPWKVLEAKNLRNWVVFYNHGKF